MKLRNLIMVAALGCGVGALIAETASATPHVLAAKKKHKRAKKKAGRGPARIKAKLSLSPKTLRFGMSLDELSRVYAKQLDKDYLPVYKRVEPGTRMKELDAEVAGKKALIKRNYIEFGGTPSGLDNGPLGGEFTYNNGEAMTKLTLRSGVKRHFFFIGKRLWKIFDERKLHKKSKLGSSYDDVVKNLTKKMKVKPRTRPANPAEKRMFDSADWTDGSITLRLYDMGGDRIALIYVDANVEDKLSKLRTHDDSGKDKLDPDIAAITTD
jgi:hypothetical protein